MRTIKNRHNFRHSQAGFSLAEILLTIGVVAVLLVSLTQVLQDLSREEVDISAASHLDQIGQAVDAMINDLDQFDALYIAVAASGGVLEMSIDEIVDPNDDGLVQDASATIITGLEPADTLAENYRFQSPHRQNYTLIFFDSSGGTGNTNLGLSYLILSNSRVDQEIAREITKSAGSQSGYYNGDINQDGTSDAIIGSAYGVWRVPLATLSGTSWHTNATSNSPSNADGWYVAYYGYININHAAKDYLYREPRPGFPQLHTMYGDLNIGGRNIIGADNVYAQQMLLNENVVVRGSALMASSDDIIVDGSIIHDGRADIATITGPQEVVVERDLNVDDFFVSTARTVVGGTTSVQNVFVNGTAGQIALEIEETLNMNNANLNTTNIFATSVVDSSGNTAIEVDESLTALSSFNVSNFNLSGGDLAVFDFVVQGGGVTTIDISSGPVTVGQIRAATDGTAQVDIDRLVACNSGCEAVTAP